MHIHAYIHTYTSHIHAYILKYAHGHRHGPGAVILPVRCRYVLAFVANFPQAAVSSPAFVRTSHSFPVTVDGQSVTH